MNNHAKTLLGGVALCALAAVPAVAQSVPHINVMALHAGNMVNKTNIHNAGIGTKTYTTAVTTAISTAADYKVKTALGATYYTWLNNSNPCSFVAKQKVTLSTKKTAYARLGTGTVTATPSGCTAPDTYWGDTYDLETKKAAGQTDTFVSTLTAKFLSGGVLYKGTQNLDVYVSIWK